MGELEVTDEPVKIVSQPAPNRSYRVDVEGAAVVIGHTRTALLRQGQRFEPGDRAVLNNLQGQPLYARTTRASAQARVNVNDASFNVVFQQRARLAASRENRATVVSDSATVGTTAAALPSNPIPDGFKAVLQSDPSNGSNISLGNSSSQDTTIQPSESVSLGVTDTSVVHAVATSAGQTLNILAEA